MELTERVTFRLDKKTKELLQSFKEKKNQNNSSIIRDLLLFYFNSEKEQEKKDKYFLRKDFGDIHHILNANKLLATDGNNILMRELDEKDARYNYLVSYNEKFDEIKRKRVSLKEILGL